MSEGKIKIGTGIEPQERDSLSMEDNGVFRIPNRDARGFSPAK
jgi:hypothetical protein